MKSGLTAKQVAFVFLMIPLSIVGMALIILFTALITGQAGFASFLFLLTGIFLFIYFPFRYKSRIQWTSVPTVLFPFFILLGAILDQTGNPIYNYPIEWKECGEHELLTRKIAHQSRGGKSSNSIEFYVINTNTLKERQVHWWTILWIRAIEYTVLGLLLILIQRFWWNWRYKGIRNLDGELLSEIAKSSSDGDGHDDIHIGNIRITIKRN